MNSQAELLAAYQSYMEENAKFEKGNNAAGTRARKALADMGKAVKGRRNEITETKNARKEEKVTK